MAEVKDGLGVVLLVLAGALAACTSFQNSVREGDENAVRSALASGTDANVAASSDTVSNLGSNAERPLHWAAFEGNESMLKLLVDKGAKVDATNSLGTTPLHWAAIAGKTGAVKFLLAHGAAVNAADAMGDTALHMAADAGRLETVEALLAAGADRAALDSDGQRPENLTCAEWTGSTPCPAARLLELLRPSAP